MQRAYHRGHHAWAMGYTHGHVPAVGRPTRCRRWSLVIRVSGTKLLVRCQRRPDVTTAEELPPSLRTPAADQLGHIP
jgi:hypothetical protein